MRKKVYFMLSSIIQIIAAIHAIIFSQKIVESIASSANIYPDGMRERITSLFENSGSTYIFIISGICILLNVLIIHYAYHDKLLKKKEKIIACSVGIFFTSTYAIIELLAIINIVVAASLKRVKPDDYPDKKKNLPIVKKENVTKDKIIKAIILLGIYFSQFIWSNLLPDNGVMSKIVGIIFYLIMIYLSIIFFNDLFRDNFRIFKDNFKTYIQNLAPIVGKYYLIYFAVALISIFLTKQGTSINQSNVEALPIWYSFPLAIIYAPIVEETLFRGCFRRFIKNDKLFIVISGICFGLLHTVFTEATVYNMIVLAIPYITMGSFLAYLYVKTNNMFSNMSFHAFQNTIAMIILLLIR